MAPFQGADTGSTPVTRSACPRVEHPRNAMLGFNTDELRVLRKLDTPKKIQDFLETIPINFEDVCRSPRGVLRTRKAHCLEGALFAAATLWLHGEPPLLLDLKSSDRDESHVVALFRRHGRWGAISKTNHAVLRYREPVYASVRELAMSYFHEYFLNDGRKTMRSFSKPLDLRALKNRAWTISDGSLDYISDILDRMPHERILRRPMIAALRKADKIEIEAGKIARFKPPKTRKRKTTP